MDMIVTRFPPSPTGLLHGGNYRTGIFNYLFARQSEGKFILRIEDTDRARSKKEYEEDILESMQWLGLKHDSFYRQSDHAPRHEQALREMIEKGHAYISKETPTEERQRSEVVRFRNPNEKVVFTDLIRGEIAIDTSDLGDFIIGKSVSEPLYHFGVVVDDFDEGVTHVIRGEDHISNTPRQILILRALGAEPPLYAHLPLVLDASRQKLSKRRGAKAITQYRDEGFIPEAIINYLALLGWHPETEQEIFSLQELVEQFDLTRIQKGAAVFDEVKLRWFNREHLHRLQPDDYYNRLTLYIEGRAQTLPPYMREIAPLLQERAETLGDAAALLSAGEFSFMEPSISADRELLLKGAKAEASAARQNLERARSLLELLDDANWNAEQIKAALWPLAEEKGRAQVLWPLRTALSGREKSPDPFAVAALIGKKKALERIAQALDLLA